MAIVVIPTPLRQFAGGQSEIEIEAATAGKDETAANDVRKATLTKIESDDSVRAVVLTGAGENFCSGGDVHEIIGPLVRMREVKPCLRLRRRLLG